MPALVAGIHVFFCQNPASKTWMAGTSPAMTIDCVKVRYSAASPSFLPAMPWYQSRISAPFQCSTPSKPLTYS